ncbi:tetratricopeptide repeat protein [Pseudoteredinibacter isoporae]|uniref:tetratricopeptide repeat protein n=1 Tax=Pseudoteredinibacter isoporae TaxID=570281 RepID=UPI003105502B
MTCLMPSKTGRLYHLLLCSLLCSVASLAYSDTEFADEPAIKDKPSSAEGEPVQKPLPTGAELPLPAEAKLELDKLEQRLIKLQEESGNFSVASSEVLLEMAKVYQSARQYEEAGKRLRQAMQVQRVNHGLYSEHQMPAAKLLVENLVAAGQWKEAREKQEFRHWLANRYLTKKPDEHLRMLLNLAQWQLHAYVFTGRIDDAHVVAAQRLYQEYFRVYKQSSTHRHDQEDLAKVLQGFIASNYFLLKNREKEGSSGFSVVAGNNDPLQQQQQELEALRSSVFVSGKKILKSMLSESSGNKEKIKQLTLSGDWFLLFGKSNTARKLYHEAQALANEEAMGVLFQTPVVIPELPRWQETFTPDHERAHIVATFDIGRDGSARNIRVEESHTKLRGKVKRQLRKTHFRPALSEEGHFVTSRDVQQSFSFP